MGHSILETISCDVRNFKVSSQNLDSSSYSMSKKDMLFSLLSYLRTDFNGFRTLFFYRLGQGKGGLFFRFFRRVLLIVFPPKGNFYIGANYIEPGGVFFHHPFSTIIHADYIGHGCVFRNNTTVGNKIKNGKTGSPSFGNNVSVGPNVVIIGDIKIGNNSVIGAGAVVVKDVPANCVVAGNPATVIKRNGE